MAWENLQEDLEEEFDRGSFDRKSLVREIATAHTFKRSQHLEHQPVISTKEILNRDEFLKWKWAKRQPLHHRGYGVPVQAVLKAVNAAVEKMRLDSRSAWPKKLASVMMHSLCNARHKDIAAIFSVSESTIQSYLKQMTWLMLDNRDVADIVINLSQELLSGRG